MSEQKVSPATCELLWGLMTEGWRPDGATPEDCNDTTGLVDSLWRAWKGAEASAPGTGHTAARRIFDVLNADGQYDALFANGPKLLPFDQRAYKTDDYIEVLRQLDYTFRLNECDDCIEVNGEPISDVVEAVIKTKLRDRGINNVNVARDAYIAEAYNNSYHPIREYLQSLNWDGSDHIGAVASHFRDRHGLFPTYFKRWSIGAVARAYGVVQNRVLGLDAPQDAGKSYFVAWLASPMKDYYIESPIQPDNKDHLKRLANKWIWEVAELGSTTRRADREALKYFLTLNLVTVRPPYARYDIRKPALASFIGTVNNEAGILNDPTGSRRFMVTTVDSIDWGYTSIDTNQVWAQAYALYQQGEPWRLTEAEARRANEVNQNYDVPDPLEDHVKTLLEFDKTRDDWTVPTNRILSLLHAAGWKLQTQRDEAMRLAPVMTRLGAKDTRIRNKKGERVRGYIRARVIGS